MRRTREFMGSARKQNKKVGNACVRNDEAKEKQPVMYRWESVTKTKEAHWTKG